MERLKLEFYYGQEAEQFTFYRLPKALITDSRFKDISNNSKLLYGLMLDRMSLSVRSGWFDDENRVYIKYSVKSIMEDLSCSKMTAVGLLKELTNIGLIDLVQRNGLANIIYVKNFVSESKGKDQIDRSKNCTGNESVPALEDQSASQTGIDIRPVHNMDESENQTAAGIENRLVPVQNLDPNKKDLNDIEFNENNHIFLSSETDELSKKEMNAMDKANAYMEIIKENIDYDNVLASLSYNDREMYEELYQIICDVVCVPRKCIRVGGEAYPYDLVKSKFLKLKAEHLQYVIGCVQKNTTKVANIRAYLTTALYNAPNTISHYYTAEVNHDMYGVD